MKVLFVSVFGLLVVLLSKMVQIHLTAIEFMILGFATMRMAQTISFNTVFEPFRKPFCKVVKDSCKAGECVVPRDDVSPFFHAIGELITCPICSGTWSALVLLTIWAYSPIPIYVFAVAGLSEYLHYGSELIEWTGRASRCVSGFISPDKE
jgi:hypothetical protein